MCDIQDGSRRKFLGGWIFGNKGPDKRISLLPEYIQHLADHISGQPWIIYNAGYFFEAHTVPHSTAVVNFCETAETDRDDSFGRLLCNRFVFVTAVIIFPCIFIQLVGMYFNDFRKSGIFIKTLLLFGHGVKP